MQLRPPPGSGRAGRRRSASARVTLQGHGGNLMESAVSRRPCPRYGPGLVTLRPQPTLQRIEAVAQSRHSWWGPGGEGLGLPGASRKDATGFGFNHNGKKKKKPRKLYSIFPVKVIILHRTKREGGKWKKKQVSAGGASPRLQTSPGIGDPSAIAPVEFFCIYVRGLSLRLRPHTSTDGAA